MVEGNAIVEGSRVTLHFSVSLTTGDIVDSNFAGKPATFHVGDGSLLPGFEEALIGLTVGSEIGFTHHVQGLVGHLATVAGAHA